MRAHRASLSLAVPPPFLPILRKPLCTPLYLRAHVPWPEYVFLGTNGEYHRHRRLESCSVDTADSTPSRNHWQHLNLYKMNDRLTYSSGTTEQSADITTSAMHEQYRNQKTDLIQIPHTSIARLSILSPFRPPAKVVHSGPLPHAKNSKVFSVT